MATVAKLIFEKSQSYAELTALRCNDRSVSYAELSATALAVAGSLIENGANKETIGIVGQRSPSSYFGILGILYAGCNYVPINPKYNQQRLMGMLRGANVRFLVGDRSSLEMLEPVLSNQDCPTMNAIIQVEGQVPIGKRWIDEQVLGKNNSLSKPIDARAEDIAYILYTSGSTGMPKGVQVTNLNVLAFLKNMATIYSLTPGFRASQTFDFSFDPSVSDMFFTWGNGGTLCVLPEDELMLPHEYIVREKISFWNSVPTVANFMHKIGCLTDNQFPELTHSMFCGEQFPKHLADAWRKCAPNSTIENLYGPTEATIYICRYSYGRNDEKKIFRNSIIPIGRPFNEHVFELIDENDQLMQNDEPGEIVFKGPQITNGYLNDPIKTSKSFVSFMWDNTADVWYRSGDLGFYNIDGDLECIGRIDNQIKLGGRRIELGEIEAVLNRYPETLGAVVVPVRDENEIVVGCVAFITAELSKESENFIRRDSENYLDRIFFPKRIISVSSFPLAPSGKIDRKALSLRASRS